eukprot:1151516-Pleurochrysis_carterae.AAC.1
MSMCTSAHVRARCAHASRTSLVCACDSVTACSLPASVHSMRVIATSLSRWRLATASMRSCSASASASTCSADG